jgi:phosphomannomutase
MQKHSVFGAYDVRGIVGHDLDDAFARKLGCAFSRHACPDFRGTFVVGRDTRPSSATLKDSFAHGITSGGHHVIDIGVVTTPLVYWYGKLAGINGSCMITASHLPSHYNGFKLSGPNSAPLSREAGLGQIEKCLDESAETKPGGSVEVRDVTADYIAELSRHLSLSRPLKIAVDAGGGAIAREISMLAEPINQLQIVELGFEDDATFAYRSPNPLDDGALTRLSAAVGQGCDFGVAFDCDGDRAVFVDELGKMVTADAVGTLIASRLLESNPGRTILHDLRFCRSVGENIRAIGGTPLRTRVGHSFIKAEMRATKAIFAAELSGHYYYADLGYADNALRTLIEMINCVSRSSKPLSVMSRECSTYATSGEINLKLAEPSKALDVLDQAFDGASKDYLDGISVDYADWWFNARPSKTEGVLRITVGSVDESALESNINRVLTAITAIK